MNKVNLKKTATSQSPVSAVPPSEKGNLDSETSEAVETNAGRNRTGSPES